MFLCRIKFEVEKGGFYTMTVATYEVEKQFLTYVKKIQNYGEALSLMFWDLRTGAPKRCRSAFRSNWYAFVRSVCYVDFR